MNLMLDRWLQKINTDIFRCLPGISSMEATTRPANNDLPAIDRCTECVDCKFSRDRVTTTQATPKRRVE